jgi:hypothetical protein
LNQRKIFRESRDHQRNKFFATFNAKDKCAGLITKSINSATGSKPRSHSRTGDLLYVLPKEYAPTSNTF